MRQKETTKPFHSLEAESSNALLRMEQASELADLGFWQWDAIENAVTFYSPGLVKILGYSPDNVPNEIFTEAGELAQIHPADLERWRRIVLEPDINPNYSYDIEFRIIRPTGEVRYLREIGRAVDERTLFGTDQDITEQKIIESELIKSRNIAEEANRAKSQFHSMISHELRTPLNGILGMAELLSDSKLDNEQRKKLESIKSCGQDLLELIDRILDMGKIATSALDVREMPFKLHELVSKVTLPFRVRSG